MATTRKPREPREPQDHAAPTPRKRTAAPRKTAAKRAPAKHTAAPRSRALAPVHAVADAEESADFYPGGLDLDTLDYDGPDGPYPFRLGGRWFHLKSAAELDVNVLGDLNRDPLLFFAQAMSQDDHEAFLGLPLPAFKMRALMDGYAEHYGLGN